jgi:hypothetical protein
MKKISKKLSLNRETLATLSPELLDAINGGQGNQSVASAITPRTTTITTTVPPSYGCQSRIVCPATLLKCVPGGAAGGQE